MITKEQFYEATGRQPENDDLERCNCTSKGIGHMSCGWCNSCNKPVFMCQCKPSTVIKRYQLIAAQDALTDQFQY